ncbi:MAG: hypothetical protein WBI07_19720 [Mobilitalea sp.]
MNINNGAYFSSNGINKTNKLLTIYNKSENSDNTSTDVKSKEQIYTELRDKMKDILDPTSGMSEDEKVKYDEKINQKIKSGEKLSGTEMRYIKIKSPYMYAMISRVQMQRQALEDKLKNCRSKEEVEEIYNTAMMHVDKDDPAREPLCAAYDNVTKEFKKSSEYKSLPQKIEESEEERRSLPTKSYKAEENEIENEYLIRENIDSNFDIKA